MALFNTRLIKLSSFLLCFVLIVSISGQQSREERLILQFSQMYSGNGEDDGYNLITDNQGNIVVVGSTTSTDWMVTNGYMEDNPSLTGFRRSGFISKFSPTGDLLASTYLGGGDHDTIRGLAINSQGNIVVAGDTLSDDFPTTDDAYNRTYGGGEAGYLGFTFCCGDAFVSILTPDLSELIYSSYLGSSGIESDVSLSIDSFDNIYLAGMTTSTMFPITPDAFQSTLNGENDAFVTKFSSNGSKMLYSTYIGGSGNDQVYVGNYLHIDDRDHLHLIGVTESSDFPISENAFDSTYDGFQDIFYIKMINQTLNYSTYIGGTNQDVGWGVDVDSIGRVHILGASNSLDFPVTEDAYLDQFQGGSCFYGTITCGDIILTTFSSNGDLVYSSYYGTKSADSGISLAVDDDDNLVMLGGTNSQSFPTQNAFQSNKSGQDDMVILSVTPEYDLRYSSYLGGPGRDWGNRVVVGQDNFPLVTGYTFSSSFPTSTQANDISGQTVVLTHFGWDIPSTPSEETSSSSAFSSPIAMLTGLSMVGLIPSINRKNK